MRPLLLLLLVAAPLAAQSPGQRVRVAAEGTRVEGHLVRLAPPGLVLRLADGTERTILRPDTLWTRSSKAKTGAIIGGITGAVAATSFGAWACEVVAEGTGCDKWGTVLLFGAAGGVGGGLVGLGIGAAIPSWRRQPVTPYVHRGPAGRLQVGVALVH